jgi:ribosomal protein L4
MFGKSGQYSIADSRFDNLIQPFLKDFNKKELKLIDQIKIDEFNNIKTKNVVQFIETLGLKETDKLLFVLPTSNRKFWLATRNLKNVIVTTANSLNIEEILKTKYIILSKSSLEIINIKYGAI